MINKDVNLSYRDYKSMNGSLLVTSIFTTIQGEGPYAGYPAVFLRLAGCNIGAKELCGFCDTRFNFNEGTHHDPVGLASKINQMLGVGKDEIKLLVVTGGEPLLQSAALNNLYAALRQLRGHGLDIQVETNGMLIDENTSTEAFYVISPKATSKNYPTLNTKAISEIAHCYKFVVTADPKSIYHKIPEWASDFKPSDIFVSAMCVYLRAPEKGEVPNIWDPTLVDIKATAENYKYAAKYALENRFTLSYQTHLFGALA